VQAKILLRFGIALLIIIIPAMVVSQGPITTLKLSGHPGSVPVMQVNARNYVDIEALARMANGSLSFNGTQVTLTLPPGAETGEAGAAAKTGFSKEFLRAGIEAWSTIREWHSALTSAIENQFPVAQAWQAPFQAQASTSVRLAQVAATTDADRSAVPLIENVFQKMKQLSDKYVAQRASLSYIAPDSLKTDSLNQSIIACGRSLEAMAESGQFVDDGSCH
jgi:hypothetical protein